MPRWPTSIIAEQQVRCSPWPPWRQIEKLLGRRINRLHVVGGGSKNELLNQFTANALQLPVVAGPMEATALGNMAVQAIALGHFKSLSEARTCVQHSSEMRQFNPQDQDAWEKAYQRFKGLIAA